MPVVEVPEVVEVPDVVEVPSLGSEVEGRVLGALRVVAGAETPVIGPQP